LVKQGRSTEAPNVRFPYFMFPTVDQVAEAGSNSDVVTPSPTLAMRPEGSRCILG
jgi:hypothetical protein